MSEIIQDYKSKDEIIDDIVKSDNEIEKKPKIKIKRNFVFTEARKEAFKRCREKRMQIIKEKKQQQKEEDVKNKYEEFKEQIISTEPEIYDKVDKTPVLPKIVRNKAKQKVKVQYESDSNSDGSVEYTIKKVNKKKEQPLIQPIVKQEAVPTINNMFKKPINFL